MSGLPDQAQEDDKGWIDTYNQAYDALAARLSALEGEKDEYLKRLDEVNVARQENEVRAILAERSVAALEGELAELRPLWHCTMEDKAAADVHFLALEGERDTLAEIAKLARAFVMTTSYYAQNKASRPEFEALAYALIALDDSRAALASDGDTE